MSRVKRSVASRKRRKKILKSASGYRDTKRYVLAKQKVEKGLQYEYRDRRTKKREIRKLWIVRINAMLRQLGTKYSIFIGKLTKSNLGINRKMLAQLAYKEPIAFKTIVEKVMNAN